MSQKIKLWKNSIRDIIKCIGFVLCFMAMETVFRIQPELRVRYVLITDEVPILFDFFYGVIFTILVAMIPPKWKKLKRGAYILLYTFLGFFMLSQYIYCRIFDRVYGLKTLQYAGEGGNFAAMVFSYFDRSFFILLLMLILIGVMGWFLLPDFPFMLSGWKKAVLASLGMAVSITGILLVPSLFKAPPESGGGVYRFKKTVYEEWIDNKRAVSMFGAYEFLFRDCYLFFQKTEVSEEDIAYVTEYFSENIQTDNEMTGILEGKNLILILMESIDDWLVNEETMPTMCKMMEEGIQFTNMYTPIFGSAGTLNAEFCGYTGLTAPANGTPLVYYTNLYYPYSLPNLFRENGYTAKSFHYNLGEFYNRQNIHTSVGFEEYVSYLDYEEDKIAQQDNTLTENEALYQKLTEKTPFFDFVITFSAHSTIGATKPYSHADEALELYPEYLGKYDSEEMDSISAKARLTDDMFAGLLERLKEDDLLKDTVIIAYGDHYDYTILDQNYLKELSDAENIYELSKTPLFIWSEGLKAQEIDKIVNTTDLYPTICNLFGLNNQNYFIGNDIFDQAYQGYAYWQDGSFIIPEGAFYSSEGSYIGEIEDKKKEEMEKLVSEKLKVNQLVLDTDYFSRIIGEE